MRRTARLGVGGLLLCAAAAAAAAPAHAAGPRILLDRAELEPSWFAGTARLRLHVTAIQLEGSLIPVAGSDPFVLLVGGARRREPYLVGAYAGTAAATAVVVVVHTGWEMRDDLESMRDAIQHLFEGLPDGTQIAVVSYGEAIDGGHRLGAARAGARLESLEPDPGPADPQLLGAVERAVTTLARASAPGGAPLRRMVVVLSNGKDADPDPARYRQVGQDAGRRGVRVHSIAYSPVDDRGPLLGLGELSKRSGGTFRWVRSREGFRPQIETLLAEINRQYVLTFFVAADQVIGKRLAVGYRELESNEVVIRKLECGAATCDAEQFCVRHACVARGEGSGGGALRWILWGAGGLVALVILIGTIGALASRGRAPAPVMPQAVPGAAPGPAPSSPGSLMVVSGPFQGQRMPLRHGFLVGSARGVDFLLPDPQVAPHHAIFVVDTTGVWGLVDRGSATGTFVNGVRITETRLQHGNLIKIGACTLRFLGQ